MRLRSGHGLAGSQATRPIVLCQLAAEGLAYPPFEGIEFVIRDPFRRESRS